MPASSRRTAKLAAALAATIMMLGWTGAGGPSARGEDVDLDAIFRCKGPLPLDPKACLAARGLILNNCTVCHTFVPIVMQQFEPGAWQGLLDRHRPRVPQLSEAQVKSIQAYLTANFNPNLDPPELSEELLKNWTTYE